MMEQYIGQQLIVDFYGCDRALLDDMEQLKAFIHRMCRCIRTEIVEESYHKFEPIGISAYAVITTSHFSIHTWPEYGYAAVDVFSCDGRLTEAISEMMKQQLGAQQAVSQMLHRHVADAPGWMRRDQNATDLEMDGELPA